MERSMPFFLALSGAIAFLLLANPLAAAAVDIVAILPDRSTTYPNGLHNGLLLSARNKNLTIEVRDVGNFDPILSEQVLQDAIASTVQPKLYCIWPIDTPSRYLVKQLHDTHRVPILQINQYPAEDWEWESIIAYAGPDDTLRASNAGIMLQQAWEEQQQQEDSVGHMVALGYPETYGGYQLSVDAFESALLHNTSSVVLDKKLPLDWGTQPAYLATLDLLHQRQSGQIKLDGLYAMDDNILMGTFQALRDMGMERELILVGTVCNGARELLTSGAQYGTTVQGPLLEGQLALTLAHEYLETGSLPGKVYFTPNPIATAETWQTMFIEFLGQAFTVDELCTWSLFYERVAGLTHVEDVAASQVCQIVDCSFVPKSLFIAGYTLLSIHYALALSCAVLLVYYRNKMVIRVAQPFFLALVILGSLVDSTSIAFMSRDNKHHSQEQLDAACWAWPWLLSLGHMMTTATLVAKIYRVKRLIENGARLRRAKVSVWHVSLFIVAFLGLDLIVLCIWYSTDPYQWTMKVSNYDLDGYITEARGQCSSDSNGTYAYPLVITMIHLSVLIYANVLAYQTSDYHKFSDSKSVAIALFNSIQLLLVGAPIMALVDDNVATSYIVRVSFVFLNNFGVLALVVVPKIYKCLHGQGDTLPTVLTTTVEKSVAAGQKPPSNDEVASEQAPSRDALVDMEARAARSQSRPSTTSRPRRTRFLTGSTHSKEKSTSDLFSMTGWSVHESVQRSDHEGDNNNDNDNGKDDDKSRKSNDDDEVDDEVDDKLANQVRVYFGRATSGKRKKKDDPFGMTGWTTYEPSDEFDHQDEKQSNDADSVVAENGEATTVDIVSIQVEIPEGDEDEASVSDEEAKEKDSQEPEPRIA